MKILLPTDGSELALMGVRHVLRLMHEGLATSVVLANVQEPASLYEIVVAHDPEVLGNVSSAAGHHALKAAQALCSEAGVSCETEIGEGGGDHLRPAIVSVLSHLGNENGGRPLLGFLEGGNPVGEGSELRIAGIGVAIDAGDDAGDGGMAAEDIFERLRDFAQRGASARGFDGGAHARCQLLVGLTPRRSQGIPQAVPILRVLQHAVAHTDALSFEEVVKGIEDSL